MQHDRLLTSAISCLVLIAAAAVAEPVVTDVDGALHPGKSLTIHGTGFGTKPEAEPVLVDHLDYADFTEGEPIKTQEDSCLNCPWLWTAPSHAEITYSTAFGEPAYRVATGGYLVHEDIYDSTSGQFFVSWRARVSQSIDPNASVRLLLIRTRSGDPTSAVTLSHNQLTVVPDEDHDGQPELPRVYPVDLNLSNDDWTNLEIAVDCRRGIELGYGTVVVWSNGVEVVRVENCWAGEPLNELASLGFDVNSGLTADGFLTGRTSISIPPSRGC